MSTLLDQARIFTMAGHEILPLLQQQKEDALASTLAAFQQGETNLLPHVAKIDAINELIIDIESKIDLYEHQLTKEQTHE